MENDGEERLGAREFFFRANRERYMDAFAMYNKTFLNALLGGEGFVKEGAVKESLDRAKTAAEQFMDALFEVAPRPYHAKSEAPPPRSNDGYRPSSGYRDRDRDRPPYRRSGDGPPRRQSDRPRRFDESPPSGEQSEARNDGQDFRPRKYVKRGPPRRSY